MSRFARFNHFDEAERAIIEEALINYENNFNDANEELPVDDLNTKHLKCISLMKEMDASNETS